MDKFIFLLFFLLLTSCYQNTIHEKVEGHIYNIETQEPEDSVIAIISLKARFGPEIPLESSLSNDLGYFEIPKSSKYEFQLPGMESGELILSVESTAILKKEGYLNDTIYLNIGMLNFENQTYKLDSLFFRPRLKNVHK